MGDSNYAFSLLVVQPNERVSKEPLPGAESSSAIMNDYGNVLFTWQDNSGTGTGNSYSKDA